MAPMLFAVQFWQAFFGIGMFSSAVFLILLVLVQRGRGGGLAGALGGMGGQMGGMGGGFGGGMGGQMGGIQRRSMRVGFTPRTGMSTTSPAGRQSMQVRRAPTMGELRRALRLR